MRSTEEIREQVELLKKRIGAPNYPDNKTSGYIREHVSNLSECPFEDATEIVGVKLCDVNICKYNIKTQCHYDNCVDSSLHASVFN